jgi:endonuclease YncB( thermonuclease family)
VKRLWSGWLAAACLLLCAASPAWTAAQTRLATVTRVSDGDTLWVRMEDGGAPRKLRLIGIDAPELCQAHGAQARDALAGLVLGRQIEIESRYDDMYGRALSQITQDGRDVARWLVAQGHAWSPGFRWHPGRYESEQHQAQASRVGLWAQSDPMLPRDFRRSHGPCQ